MSKLNNSKALEKNIWRFDPFENVWKLLGNLNLPRYGHGVIHVNNKFFVVGGGTTTLTGVLPTESCELVNSYIHGQQIKCTYWAPQLKSFTFYPELMLLSWFLINIIKSITQILAEIITFVVTSKQYIVSPKIVMQFKSY